MSLPMVLARVYFQNKHFVCISEEFKRSFTGEHEISTANFFLNKLLLEQLPYLGKGVSDKLTEATTQENHSASHSVTSKQLQQRSWNKKCAVNVPGYHQCG